MRDRLKKLIEESSDKVLSIPYISEAGAESLADYLIENGVQVQNPSNTRIINELAILRVLSKFNIQVTLNLWADLFNTRQLDDSAKNKYIADTAVYIYKEIDKIERMFDKE